MLPVAYALSRAAAVAIVLAGPPLATDGLGATYAPGIRRGSLVLSIAIAVGMAMALLRVWALAVVAITLVLGVACRRVFVARLGGVNGDVAGACQQVLEVALLLLGSAHFIAS